MSEEITEQTVVSRENYAELLNMMKSEDTTSREMALIIMENSDHSLCAIPVLALLKEGWDHFAKGKDDAFLSKNYPKLYSFVQKKITSRAASIQKLSLRKLYELAVESKDINDVVFVMTVLQTELFELLDEYQFEFLEYITVLTFPRKDLTNMSDTDIVTMVRNQNEFGK